MKLMFLSTLERRREDYPTESAQVSIVEHQGAWRVLWSREEPDGRTEQECWYEGINWKEMLEAFRNGLRMKRAEDYVPLIEEGKRAVPGSGRQRQVLILQYYGQKHCNEALFEELRKWRRAKASNENKSAFFVATNRMLQMVSTYVPQTKDELQAIPGFGPRKTEQYAQDVLAVTGRYARGTSFPLDWVEEEVSEPELEAWLIEEQRSKEELEEKQEQQRRQALETISGGCSLEELENNMGLKRIELVRLVEELDRLGYDMEPLLAVELAGLSAEEAAAVEGLFAKLGTRMLKPVLMALYSEEERKEKELGRLYELLRLQRIRFLRHQDRPTAEEGEMAAG